MMTSKGDSSLSLHNGEVITEIVKLSVPSQQLGGWKIKRTFHENHLKLFVPRTGHLVQAKDVPLLEHQTI
jgi:hypothetical protein